MDEDEKGQPHDGLFRIALAQIEDARTALATAMPPKLSAALDLSRLERLPARLVDAELRAGETDALFEVPFRNHDVSLVIYVPVEHQSQTDVDMPLRLHRTMGRLWDKQRDEGRRLSPVIPLVVSHGRRWSGPRSMLERLAMPDEIVELIEEYTPQSTYMLDDLADYDPATLAQRLTLTPLVRAAYFVLQWARESPALETVLPLIARDLARLAKRPGAQSLLVTLIRYILRVANGDYDAMRAQLREAIGPKLGDIVMGTVAEQLIERGRVEGEVRGEARAEARERMLVVRLLEHKFGPLERGVLDRLANASIDSIEIFAERVLTEEKIEDVLKE
jgi:hypothetical protein